MNGFILFLGSVVAITIFGAFIHAAMDLYGEDQ